MRFIGGEKLLLVHIKGGGHKEIDGKGRGFFDFRGVVGKKGGNRTKKNRLFPKGKNIFINILPVLERSLKEKKGGGGGGCFFFFFFFLVNLKL